MPRGELAERRDVGGGERAHAALELDGLDDDRGHVARRERRGERVDVAEGQRLRAGQVRRERIAEEARAS